VISVVNAGGDADTTGALAGMLLGATGGVAAIPGEWLKRLEPKTRAEIIGQVSALLAIAGVPDFGKDLFRG
jgi:ADP-ribosyl-[dinitrogen reductase] hydrolase